jgi:hypothetical protein
LFSKMLRDKLEDMAVERSEQIGFAFI